MPKTFDVGAKRAQSRQATASTPASSRNGDRKTPKQDTGTVAKVVLSAAVLIVAIVAGAFVFNNITSDRENFVSHTAAYEFKRDAFTGSIDNVPVEDLFSAENIEKYQNGLGFTAKFVLLNDPANNYRPTVMNTCGVEAWQTYFETSAPERRALVEKRKAEFGRCVEEFRNAKVEVVRTIEVALDDTEGVNSQFQDFVRRSLEDVARPQNLASKIHTTRFYFFRLTDADYRDFRRREIAPGTDPALARQEWESGLEWLLEERGPKKSSSIATGLFNALEMNEAVRLRQIYVISDGMENSPLTTSFYPVVRADPKFLETGRWADRDADITRYKNCAATGIGRDTVKVSWFMPQLPGLHFRSVQAYWQHVLRDVCRNKTAEVIY